MKTMKNMKKLFLTIVIALASMTIFASNSSVEAKLSMGASRIFALNQESGYLADGLTLAVETSMTTDLFTAVAAGSYTYSPDMSVADATLSLRRDARLTNRFSMFLEAGAGVRMVMGSDPVFSALCRGGLSFDFSRRLALVSSAGLRVLPQGTIGVDAAICVDYQFM